MTNEKFLERLYGIIKAIDKSRDSYHKVEFDGSMVSEHMKKMSADELKKFSIRLPEIEFATLISELNAEIREAENKKKAGKGGTAKVKALNSILKNNKNAGRKESLQYANEQTYNGQNMQVFCDGYRAVALSENDRIETETIPDRLKGEEYPLNLERITPSIERMEKRYTVNVNALKALYKAKAAEWKTYKSKCDDKAPCIKWNEKVGYNLDYLMDCVNGLNADNLIMEDYGELAVKVLRNESGSFALVLPIMAKPKKGESNLNPHKWAMDSEVDGIFTEIQ